MALPGVRAQKAVSHYIDANGDFVTVTVEDRLPVNAFVSGKDSVDSAITRTVTLNESGNFIVADHFDEISKGNIADHEIINKFGRNDVLSTTIEDLDIIGGVYSWPESASTLEAISSDANDDDGGSGARTITIEGLDASFDEISETLTMNGTSATSATSQSFIRVNKAYVETCGTYASTTAGTQAGTITIRISSAGATQAIIARPTIGVATPIGESQVSRYTVPNGKEAYLLSAVVSGDSSKATSFYMWQRKNADDTSAPMSPKRLVLQFDDLNATLAHRPRAPEGPFTAKTDIWWSAAVGTGNGEASVNYQLSVRNK